MTAAALLETLSEEEVWELARALNGRLILSGWRERQKDGETEYYRMKHFGDEEWDATVQVFRSWPGRFGDPTWCQKEGWYYRVRRFAVDFCEHCNSSDPFDTAEAAKSYVDQQLRAVPGAVVVGG